MLTQGSVRDGGWKQAPIAKTRPVIDLGPDNFPIGVR
jgi:hypothetical protein